MSLEAKRGNHYEDTPSDHNVASVREKVAQLSSKFSDIKYRASDKQEIIRGNFDQLKRLLDQSDETLLSDSEYNLAEGLLNNIQNILELPIDANNRQRVDTRPISVVLQAVPRSSSELGSSVFEAAPETNEATASSDEAIDFSNGAQIESYDQELLEGTKNAFSNQPFFKEHNLVKGLQALGTMRVVFVRWDRALQQLKANPNDAHAAKRLNKHYDKIQDLIEVVNIEVLNFHKVHEVDASDVAAIENVQTLDNKTKVAITNKISPQEQFILDQSMRVEEKSVDVNEEQRLTMVSLPEAEQKEINEVHRMEEVIARMEAETAELQKLSSWRPASEAGNVTAMMDQFKRTLVNYYVQPSLALFERLQNTFGTIETLHREAKEAGVDMVAMLADVQSFERDLPRLERLPSTNTFERSNLRAFIENFRGLYARYIRAEAGEEKNILMRQLAKMHSNITEAHKDVLASVLEKPVTELDSLKQEVETLLKDPSLSVLSRQALSFVENEMLTRLGVLMPGDAEYNQLLEKAKEAVTAAKQLSEEIPDVPVPHAEELINSVDVNLGTINKDSMTMGSEVAVVSPMVLEEPIITENRPSNVIRIEGVANRYLAPETEKKLSNNQQLIAASLLATASVMSPDKLSEYSENVQVSSADIGSISKYFGDGAIWGGADFGQMPVAIDEVTKKVFYTPVVPNTAKVAEAEAAKAAAAISVVENNAVPLVDKNIEKTPEQGVVTTLDTGIINTPAVSEVVSRSGYEPEALVINEAIDTSPTLDTSVPELVVPLVAELDPKSPAYQESIAPTESVTSDNNVVEVLRGNEATYPDRAINPILAAVDAKGLPEVLANKLRAEEKEAFLSDANRLKAAGLGSGQKNVTFPGEIIDYRDAVRGLEQRFNEYRQYVNVPHTEVAETGDTRTSLTLESYARDLQLIPKEDQLNLVSAAVETYYANAEGRETLNGEDKDTLKPGAVVPLQGVAPFLAAEIANYVRKTVAAESAESRIDTVVETENESGSASAVIEDKGEPGEVTSPEEYPGGVLAFSQAYNQLLESFGIAIKAPAMFDSWFTVDRAEYNNRELLGMTVGEITTIMMQDPVDVMRELTVRKISPEAANTVYQFVIEARKNGLAPYATDTTITLEEVIKRKVLADASTNK